MASGGRKATVGSTRAERGVQRPAAWGTAQPVWPRHNNTEETEEHLLRVRLHVYRISSDEWFSRHPELAKFVLHRTGWPAVMRQVLNPVLIGCREELLKQTRCVQ